MKDITPSDQHIVEQIVRDFSQSVSDGDRDGIRAHHGEDLVMFDFPDTVHGLAEYDRTWDFFYTSQRAPISFAPSNLSATVGQQVAFVFTDVHCDGTTAGAFDFRLTVGLVKIDDSWAITHEHHSMPTKEAVLTMPEKQDDLGIHSQ